MDAGPEGVELLPHSSAASGDRWRPGAAVLHPLRRAALRERATRFTPLNRTRLDDHVPPATSSLALLVDHSFRGDGFDFGDIASGGGQFGP